MPLPVFNEHGDLPVGVHPASLDEVCAHFGGGSSKRRVATRNLRRLHQLASGTGKVQRFIVFGSYVTAKPDPNDVDVFLVMCDDFQEEGCPAETLALFKHQRGASELGASVFWARPTMILRETVEEFIAGWQIKRDLSKRGIVEVIG